jgi:hypothetical protein
MVCSFDEFNFFFSILSIDIKLIENWVIAVSKKYLNIGLVFDFMIVYFCYYIVFKKQIIISMESITRFTGLAYQPKLSDSQV